MKAIPVILVVLCMYGLMWATGIPFGPVTATLAALAIGIGVPFTIHLVRRSEENRIEFDDIAAVVALAGVNVVLWERWHRRRAVART